MSYALTVYDPSYTVDGKELYAGLKSVSWNVTSDQEGLIVTEGNNHNKDTDEFTASGTKSATYTVPVNITKSGETNAITLTVIAEDYAGNITTYEQYLAIDNLAPRVTVTFDNNSVLT